MKKERYIVELIRPEGVSKLEMKEYIEEAVAAWKGQLYSEDPMFYLDWETVKCLSFRKKST